MTHNAAESLSGLTRYASLPVALTLAIGLCLPRDADATVVVRASLEQLTAVSEVILHGVVQRVDDDLSTGPNGPFRTRIEIEVVEAIKGVGSESRIFRFELPGGRAGNRTMRIPGMPTFRSGDEVVLLLEPVPRGGYALAGLAQGVFRVDRSVAVPAVRRSLKGNELVRGPDGGMTRLPVLPATLPELKLRLRQLVGGDR